jgi:hypothetical protein
VLGVEGCCQGPCSTRAYAAHLAPGGLVGVDDRCERTEVAEKSLRGGPGHPGYASQSGLRGWSFHSPLWSLGKGGPVLKCRFVSTVREAREPKGRVGRVGRAEQRDTEICQREARAAYRCRCEWPIVEVISFDEQVGKARCLPKSSELWPERPTDDCEVQAAHGLAFDEGAAANVVVTIREALDLDDDGVTCEMRRDATRFLANVDSYPHNERTMPRPSFGKRAKPVPTRNALARSRSERA